MTHRALVLDLGSTRLKLAAMTARGALQMVVDRSFPEMTAKGLICEGDPISLRDRIQAMLEKAATFPIKVPLGISCQRSSFLIWERKTGKPLTRLISWQDRRAQAWCEHHEAWQPLLWRLTGLPFSPHYAGPKVAYLLAKDRWLAAMARSGDACFGTLETYLCWNWSRGEIFRTDPGMAARTQLFDLERGEWSQEVLTLFGIPRAMLPEIKSFASGQVKTPDGRRLMAVVPDQSAAAIPLFSKYPRAVVLNAGTGTFLLRQGEGRAPNGFLTVRLDRDQHSGNGMYWEAPINAGAELWRQAKPYADFEIDPWENHFATPEKHGWAAPYWRGDLGQSCTGSDLPEPVKGRLLLEGYAYRVRQAIEGIFPDEPPERVLVGGGLARDDLWLQLLARHIPLPLFKLSQAQLSLLGVGWLVDGRRLDINLHCEPIAVDSFHRDEKRYAAWTVWSRDIAMK